MMPSDHYFEPVGEEGYVTRDLDCPECGEVEEDADDVLLTTRDRQGGVWTLHAACGVCGHEWKWVEDPQAC